MKLFLCYSYIKSIQFVKFYFVILSLCIVTFFIHALNVSLLSYISWFNIYILYNTKLSNEHYFFYMYLKLISYFRRIYLLQKKGLLKYLKI